MVSFAVLSPRAWRMKGVMRQWATYTVSAVRIGCIFALIHQALVLNNSVASSSFGRRPACR